MSVTTTNLIQGPGTLWTGAFGATEPAQTLAATIADPSTGWTDVGGTTDGATLTINQEFSELAVDQIVDVPGRRMTKRDVSVKTNMAEPTLENLAVATNRLRSVVDTATTNLKILEPLTDNSATQPTYTAVIVDGYAPGQFRRRVVVRKTLSTDNVAASYTKDNQTVFPVTWSAHYVSSGIKPYVVIDALAAS